MCTLRQACTELCRSAQGTLSRAFVEAVETNICNIVKIIRHREAGVKALTVVLATLAGFVALIGIMFVFLNMGMNDVRKLVINDVDLTKIADGSYAGSYHKGRWAYDVKVSVKDHKITTVEVTNKRMAMMKEFNAKAEAEILKRQSPRIDVVSGATISSKAYGKAVEMALSPAAK
jgi:uncharacterized protein with FMN-binding domain